jgi:hypothetical protein
MKNQKPSRTTASANRRCLRRFVRPQQPASDTWDKYQTKYLPGDLVRTEFGKAIIREASSNGSYSVWPLPGWKWRRETWGWSPVKLAWYDDDELKIIKWGAAHYLRPNEKS